MQHHKFESIHFIVSLVHSHDYEAVFTYFDENNSYFFSVCIEGMPVRGITQCAGKDKM
jgi:hypothetical protein